MSERPRLVIVPTPDTSAVEADLREAMRADLEDLLSEYTFSIARLEASGAQEIFANMGQGVPTLILAEDMLNPSPAVLESMVEALEYFDGVLCPAFDGSIVAASCFLEEDEAEEAGKLLAESFAHAAPDLAELTDGLLKIGLNMMVQPPWYRASNGESATRFALAHMQSMLLTGDEDFVAERTRMHLMG